MREYLADPTIRFIIVEGTKPSTFLWSEGRYDFMFDLHRDLDRYQGAPPYASEMYGMYQPLLGWSSRLTQSWLSQGRTGFDPRIKRILDQHITPPLLRWVPEDGLNLESRLEGVAAGQGRRARIRVRNVFDSRLLDLAADHVQGFHDGHDRMPAGEEWADLFPIERYIADQGSDLRRVQEELHRAVMVEPSYQENFDIARAADTFKRRIEYETQVAAFIFWAANNQNGLSASSLSQLFYVEPRPPLSTVAEGLDPLAAINPRDHGGVLSPVGMVTLFRQYFFDLGTFLGEPIEHIWLAPGTTTELVEAISEREVIETISERLLEATTRSETEASGATELSNAVRAENEASTKLGISTTHSANVGVYEGTATGSFDIASARKDARETTAKTTREQTEKHASELKRTQRTSRKRTTETATSTSRRHVIANPDGKLVNYELRRKMRRVGVQLQDLGQRLCWQVFVDDPGSTLGLADLVHFAKTPDLDKLADPTKLPPPATKSVKTSIALPFKPVLDYTNNRAHYEYQKPEGSVHLGIIKGDDDDDDSQIVIDFPKLRVDPPETGYAFNGRVEHRGTQGNKVATIREIKTDKAQGTFDIILQRVCFGGEASVTIDLEIFFDPTPDEKTRVEGANTEAKDRFDADRNRLIRKAYEEALRERIKAAASIRQRPPWDLREEERTVVYRKLIERLMLDQWHLPNSAENRRLAHVRSEIVRSLFDIDSMLYFVAPEWWQPKRHKAHFDPTIKVQDTIQNLGEEDKIAWGIESRDDNYLITEDSHPARLGTSLGWLLQLDGDNLRNAFLNAPWVKAVVPIRPGKEREALNWLHAVEGEEGWSAPYLGAGQPEERFDGKTIGEVLAIMADELEEVNKNKGSVLAEDQVFEKGFSHLAQSFDAGIPPNEPFTQWICVVPTDQVVAREYESTDLFEP